MKNFEFLKNIIYRKFFFEYNTGWLISSVTFFVLVKFNFYSYNNSVNHIYNLTRD